ncbi:MAG: hypothetical protein LBG67_01680 [Campylobacteraceae bacterium]|nr:hypothetical protein [Campylobacteraceae bacterium]
MKEKTHKIDILRRLYVGGEKLTATDFSYISNPNQYFVALENEGFTISEWGHKGKARVKYRFIPLNQREKVNKFLNGEKVA